jgi:hypothetical protein
MAAPVEIRGGIELPAVREHIELHTEDGLTLVGELAVPAGRPPVATLVTLHPLPTSGGFMDSHILRKAAGRLPALADLAVLRFNTRGTSSPRGTSEGSFGHGDTERGDVAAAMAFVAQRGLPNPWLVGWSFGTELAAWAGDERDLVVLVPEHDDYLRPESARARFASVPDATVIAVDGAKHLWVGENQTRRVLNEIVAVVNPSAGPLPDEWVDEG